MSLGPFTGYGRRTSPRPSLVLTSTEWKANPPTKADCPGHVAGRDSIGRYPLGDCGPDCLLRAYRLGTAIWDGQAWKMPNTVKAT